MTQSTIGYKLIVLPPARLINIFATVVFALNMAGDGLRDALGPRHRARDGNKFLRAIMTIVAVKTAHWRCTSELE